MFWLIYKVVSFGVHSSLVAVRRYLPLAAIFTRLLNCRSTFMPHYVSLPRSRHSEYVPFHSGSSLVVHYFHAPTLPRGVGQWLSNPKINFQDPLPDRTRLRARQLR